MNCRNIVLAFCAVLVVTVSVPRVHAGDDSRDVLLAAMQDELARSMDKLRVKELARPYFIEYEVDQISGMRISASFGALVSSEARTNRPFRVGVRVGDYAFDNSNFVGDRWSWHAQQRDGLVLDDNYAALRRDLWLVTDRQYKQALEDISDKRAALKNRIQPEELPDFTRAAAVRVVEPPARATIDVREWEARARRLSAIARNYPAVQDSEVNFFAGSATTYYVNSEGAVVREPVPVAYMQAEATTQAADGMKLWNYAAWYARDPARLPSEDAMAQDIRAMAQELTDLVKAPVVDEYLGPVLFVDDAATEIFAKVFAPEVVGERPPVYAREGDASHAQEPKLSGRLNRRVLPHFVSVTDDPALTVLNGEQLIGHYRVDNEGIPGERLTLVEKGVLKSLLMTRRPHKKIAQSNGHARTGQRGEPRASFSNLVVSADEGKTLDELKAELREMCTAQELPYGLIIRRTEGSISAPVLVYTIDVKTGREQLVRGLAIPDLPVFTLKDIVAVGSTPHVSQGVLAGVPVSVAAPPLLLEELELKKVPKPQVKPVILAHPYFGK